VFSLFGAFHFEVGLLLAMFNNDTVSMDTNPVMSMFAATGSKEINLETELFSLIPCSYAYASFCG